jgi:hypothetical protein
VEKDTKTHQMRRIALDTETVGLLRELKDRWRKRLDDLGLELTDDRWVARRHTAVPDPSQRGRESVTSVTNGPETAESE